MQIILNRKWAFLREVFYKLHCSVLNSLAEDLGDGMQRSLYVDDFFICYISKNMNSFERQLQLCLHKIQNWVDENGLNFSKT